MKESFTSTDVELLFLPPPDSARRRRVSAVRRSPGPSPRMASYGDGRRADTAPAPRRQTGSVFYFCIGLALRDVAVELRNLRGKVCDFPGEEQLPDDIGRDDSTELFHQVFVL